MKDPFAPIYELMRSGSYREVIELLVNQRRNKIRPPFDVDDNHAWYIAGDAFYKLEIFGDAGSCFRRALDVWPEDVDAMHALANTYSELGQAEKAVEVLRKAIVLQPHSDALKYNFGNALFDLGHYVEAIAAYGDVKNDKELIELARRNAKKAKLMLGRRGRS